MKLAPLFVTNVTNVTNVTCYFTVFLPMQKKVKIFGGFKNK